MTIQTPPRPGAATSVGSPAASPGATGPGATDPSAPGESGPRLHGVVDVLRPDRVAGWVIDRRDPRACAMVTVLREGRAVATLRADRHRKDLEQGGVGTGRYGFSAPLDPPLDPGLEFTLKVVARTADGAELPLRAQGAATAPAPERRLLERVWEDLGDVRAATGRTDAALAGALDRLAQAMDRIEVMQARLEAQPGPAAPARRPGHASLWLMAGLALATGLGSLGLGLWSLWGA